MINPNLLEDVKLELSRRGLDLYIYVEDVQSNINNEVCKDYTVYHSTEEVLFDLRGFIFALHFLKLL